jgi:hypothetical protein
MRPGYPNRKHIKKNYETQFSINLLMKDKTEKKSIKKTQKTTRINQD